MVGNAINCRGRPFLVGLSMVDMPQGWMRQIIGASASRRLAQPFGCVGHFFDNARKQLMTVELGYVFVRCPFSFRSALCDDEPVNVLSWAAKATDLQSAVPNDELPDHAARFFEAAL